MGRVVSSRGLAESSELLRLSLPLMAKYTVPVSPPNYAVWYAYVGGDNFSLKVQIDGLIQKGVNINEDITQKLYNKYVDPSSAIDRAEDAQKALDSIAGAITDTIKTASGEASRYEESLESYQGRIAEGMKAEQVQSLIGELSELTHDMRNSNEVLLKDLVDARSESDLLRKELKIAKTEAYTDPLTELANRKAFFDRIDEMDESGELQKGTHSIVLADIDNFKQVNDTYGHLFGDKVIKVVAAILSNYTKGKDLAARYGGEEFILLLPDTDIGGARSVAENIRKNMEVGRIIKPKTGEEISQITLSFGIAEMSKFELINDVIARADEALYTAKANGRNRVELAKPE